MGTEPVTWKLDEHTKAKHELLRAFFNKWVSVHSEWFAQRRGGLVRITTDSPDPASTSVGSRARR